MGEQHWDTTLLGVAFNDQREIQWIINALVCYFCLVFIDVPWSLRIMFMCMYKIMSLGIMQFSKNENISQQIKTMPWTLNNQSQNEYWPDLEKGAFKKWIRLNFICKYPFKLLCGGENCFWKRLFLAAERYLKLGRSCHLHFGSVCQFQLKVAW